MAAQTPDKSSSELSNSPTLSKAEKKKFIGGFAPGSVKKLIEDQMAATGKSQSEVIRDAIVKSSVGPVPAGIMNLAYGLVPIVMDGGGEVVQATRLTGQTGIKTTARGPDRRVREAESKQTAATSDNLVWAFNNSVALRATLHLIGETIKGAGWSIDSENENEAAKNTIEEFIDNTNLPEWIEATIENLAIFGNNINTLKTDDDGNQKLVYVDWSTFYMFKHPLTGEVRYVQVVKVPSDLPKTEKDWAAFDITASHTGTEEIKQPVDPDIVIHAKIGARGFEVGQSLIAPVITLVVYEKLIQYFMVQGAEVYGTPRIIASLQLGEMPMAEDKTTRDALQEQMSLVSAALQNFRNFGVLTLPPGWKVDIYGPGQHMMDYEKILNYIRREQMLSCLGSTALFEAKGAELATSRTIETVWGYGLEGWRRVLKDVLDNQVFPKVLGVDRGATDVEINFNSERKWTAAEGAQLVGTGIITKEEAREEWGYPELPPQPEQPPGFPGAPSPFGPPGQPPGLPTELPTGQPTSPLTAFELSNQRPRRDPKYEAMSRRIEEVTAKACQESLEKAKQRIRVISLGKEPDSKK